MEKFYTIKYCQKDKQGNFFQVTPDIATFFRVFELKNGKSIHVKDFYPLSEANKFIKEQREKEIKAGQQEPEGRKSRSFR